MNISDKKITTLLESRNEQALKLLSENTADCVHQFHITFSATEATVKKSQTIHI